MSWVRTGRRRSKRTLLPPRSTVLEQCTHWTYGSHTQHSVSVRHATSWIRTQLSQCCQPGEAFPSLKKSTDVWEIQISMQVWLICSVTKQMSKLRFFYKNKHESIPNSDAAKVADKMKQNPMRMQLNLFIWTSTLGSFSQISFLFRGDK